MRLVRRQPTFGRTYIDDKTNQPVAVEREVSYQSAEDITASVDKDDLVKAYRYGKTLVPFNKVDEEQMSVHNDKCLSILGFAKSSEVRPPHPPTTHTAAGARRR